jgi:uncharacterized protein YbaR (Trm112 family)
MARSTGQPVWVCRDRLAAARAAVAAGAGVLIADDGLQHLRLRRDVELVVVRLGAWPRQWSLPAGRALAGACRTAGRGDARDLQRRGASLPGRGNPHEARSATEAVRIGDGETGELESFAAGGCMLWPASATRAVFPLPRGERARGHPGIRSAITSPCPTRLLAPTDGCPVLMTSKDAMRCAGRARQRRCLARAGASATRAREAPACWRCWRSASDCRKLEPWIIGCWTYSRARSARGRWCIAARQQELVCRGDRLAWPIRDGVPVMLVAEAREISQEELLDMEQRR